MFCRSSVKVPGQDGAERHGYAPQVADTIESVFRVKWLGGGIYALLKPSFGGRTEFCVTSEPTNAAKRIQKSLYIDTTTLLIPMSGGRGLASCCHERRLLDLQLTLQYTNPHKPVPVHSILLNIRCEKLSQVGKSKTKPAGKWGIFQNHTTPFISPP